MDIYPGANVLPSLDIPGLGPALELVASPVQLVQKAFEYIAKTMSIFFKEGFPKLELGDVHTRPLRLRQWRVSVTNAVKSISWHVVAWWLWIADQADRAYRRSLDADLLDREQILPDGHMPDEWAMIENWFYDKLLDKVPPVVRESAKARVRVDYSEPCHFFQYHEDPCPRRS